MKYETAVMPAKAGIQCWCGFTSWTPAFAGVTTSYINGPDHPRLRLKPQRVRVFPAAADSSLLAA